MVTGLYFCEDDRATDQSMILSLCGSDVPWFFFFFGTEGEYKGYVFMILCYQLQLGWKVIRRRKMELTTKE